MFLLILSKIASPVFSPFFFWAVVNCFHNNTCFSFCSEMIAFLTTSNRLHFECLFILICIISAATFYAITVTPVLNKTWLVHSRSLMSHLRFTGRRVSFRGGCDFSKGNLPIPCSIRTMLGASQQPDVSFTGWSHLEGRGHGKPIMQLFNVMILFL